MTHAPVGTRTVFCHQRFARNQRFKLSGEWEPSDIYEDVLEQNVIPAGEGWPEAQVAREKLQAVLDRMKK